MKHLAITTMLTAIFISAYAQRDPTIGKSIKIGKLEIAQYDFPYKLNWYDAKNECKSLGTGWRLPTEDELGILSKYMEKIGNFNKGIYWSLEGQKVAYMGIEIYGTLQMGVANRSDEWGVRAVRTVRSN